MADNYGSRAKEEGEALGFEKKKKNEVNPP